GEMLIDKIGSEEFYSLRDEDALSISRIAYGVIRKRIFKEKDKNKAKNNKTEHEMEKSERQSQIKAGEPIGRLRPDAFKAKAELWVSSRAFFDGRICESPQIPPAVRNDIYQRVDE
ncbi:hypothetical protein Tco_1186829, partial [Tanacetum coccineum]